MLHCTFLLATTAVLITFAQNDSGQPDTFNQTQEANGGENPFGFFDIFNITWNTNQGAAVSTKSTDIPGIAFIQTELSTTHSTSFPITNVPSSDSSSITVTVSIPTAITEGVSTLSHSIDITSQTNPLPIATSGFGDTETTTVPPQVSDIMTTSDFFTVFGGNSVSLPALTSASETDSPGLSSEGSTGESSPISGEATPPMGTVNLFPWTTIPQSPTGSIDLSTTLFDILTLGSTQGSRPSETSTISMSTVPETATMSDVTISPETTKDSFLTDFFPLFTTPTVSQTTETINSISEAGTVVPTSDPSGKTNVPAIIATTSDELLAVTTDSLPTNNTSNPFTNAEFITTTENRFPNPFLTTTILSTATSSPELTTPTTTVLTEISPTTVGSLFNATVNMFPIPTSSDLPTPDVIVLTSQASTIPSSSTRPTLLTTIDRFPNPFLTTASVVTTSDGNEFSTSVNIPLVTEVTTNVPTSVDMDTQENTINISTIGTTTETLGAQTTILETDTTVEIQTIQTTADTQNSGTTVEAQTIGTTVNVQSVGTTFDTRTTAESQPVGTTINVETMGTTGSAETLGTTLDIQTMEPIVQTPSLTASTTVDSELFATTAGFHTRETTEDANTMETTVNAQSVGTTVDFQSIGTTGDSELMRTTVNDQSMETTANFQSMETTVYKATSEASTTRNSDTVATTVEFQSIETTESSLSTVDAEAETFAMNEVTTGTGTTGTVPAVETTVDVQTVGSTLDLVTSDAETTADSQTVATTIDFQTIGTSVDIQTIATTINMDTSDAETTVDSQTITMDFQPTTELLETLATETSQTEVTTAVKEPIMGTTTAVETTVDVQTVGSTLDLVTSDAETTADSQTVATTIDFQTIGTSVDIQTIATTINMDTSDAGTTVDSQTMGTTMDFQPTTELLETLATETSQTEGTTANEPIIETTIDAITSHTGTTTQDQITRVTADMVTANSETTPDPQTIGTTPEIDASPTIFIPTTVVSNSENPTLQTISGQDSSLQTSESTVLLTIFPEGTSSVPVTDLPMIATTANPIDMNTIPTNSPGSDTQTTVDNAQTLFPILTDDTTASTIDGGAASIDPTVSSVVTIMPNSDSPVTVPFTNHATIEIPEPTLLPEGPGNPPGNNPLPADTMTPILRGYDFGSSQHFYTTDQTAFNRFLSRGAREQVSTGALVSTQSYASANTLCSSLIPVSSCLYSAASSTYRLLVGGTQRDCSLIGFGVSGKNCGATQPLYELRNKYFPDFFYTTSAGEANFVNSNNLWFSGTKSTEPIVWLWTG